MEITEVKSAIDAVGQGFEEFKATQEANLKQRDVLLEEKLAKINKSLDEQQKIVDDAALALKRAQNYALDNPGGEDLEAKAAQWMREVTGDIDAKFSADQMAEYKADFTRWMRKGAETKALSVGSDPDGGFVVYPDMSGRVVSKIYETSPMRAYATVQTIGTDALEGLFDLDEAGAEWVGETQSRDETTTPQMGKYRIPAHELSAKPQATQKLLDDAAISIDQWLAMKVADKFARAEATAFVTGDGDGKPRGFLTYPVGTTLPGTIEQTPTGASGAFVADPDGGDALINIQQSLKSGYRSGASWFMNRRTVGPVRLLKDGDGNYLWRPSLEAGQPSTLLGDGIAPFEDMPDIAANSLSIAYGDMRSAYTVVDRVGIRVLRDPYSNKPYVQFYTTKRVGGDVVNFEAIKLLKFAVSV